LSCGQLLLHKRHTGAMALQNRPNSAFAIADMRSIQINAP